MIFSSRLKQRLIALGRIKATVFLAFLISCSSNPVTGKKELSLISESQEISIGEQSYSMMQQSQGGIYVTDPSIEKYVKRVGARLAAVSDRPNLPYEFVVLDNSIPNAWSLPGGKIAINRGLLVELHSEAELAAVLSHEIVHSAARHGAKNLERGLLMESGLIGLSQLLKGHKYEDVAIGSAGVGAGLMILKYSRDAEREADYYGIKYMVAAGYDPQAAAELQRTFLKLSATENTSWLGGLFATHPPSEERLQANMQAAATYVPGGKIGTKEYQDAIATLRKDQPAYQNLDKGYEALIGGHTQKALKLAEEGIQIEPQEAHLYNLKGKAHLKLKQHTQAMDSFNRAIELNPGYFDFYLQRGLLEYDLNQNSSARTDLEKSLGLFPSADAHFTLGNIDLTQGHTNEALAHFRIASNVNSSIGNLAKIKATRIDLPHHPNEYIHIEVDRTSTGFVNFYIQNTAPLAVHHLIVELAFYNSQRRLIAKKTITIPDTIAPNQKIYRPSSFHMPRHAAYAEAFILKADLIDH
jgi:beta-barrel assembly-enhancing protease